MIPIMKRCVAALIGQVALMAMLPQLFKAAVAQEQSPGTCPTFKVVTNFDPQKYLGRWYQYSNNAIRFQNDTSCDIAQYSDMTEPGKPLTIGVFNRAVRDGAPGKFSRGAKGTAVLGEPSNPDNPGKLIVNFYDPASRVQRNTTNYNILDTDYGNFTTVYNCRQVNESTKSEFLWILTREQSPPKALVDKATAIIQGNGIDTSRLKKTRQANCPDPDMKSHATHSNPSLASMSMAIMCSFFARAKF